MLVLSRKVGESVMIGDGIVVTVLGGRGDSIRIGIQAPREVAVNRSEVIDAVREENLAAAATTSQWVPSLPTAA